MILFFLRRFNDIDHIVPIVYRFAKDGHSGDIAVLALNPELDFTKDFRLKFLIDKYGVTVDSVYRFYQPTTLQRFMAKLICSPAHSGPGMLNMFFRKTNQLCKSILKEKYVDRVLYGFAFRRIFGDDWARGMLKSRDVRLLVFDWQKIGRYVTHSLAAAARTLNVSTAAVPHGIALFKNSTYTLAAFRNNRPPDYAAVAGWYDDVIMPFEHLKDIAVRAGVPSDKIHVLGSTRFCSEWEEIYHALTSDGNSENAPANQGGKVKIVFMDHNPLYRINVDVVLETIEKLAELDYVDLIIKPSTGSNTMTSAKLRQLARIDTQTSSNELIRWADVVMGTTSSILLEALLMGRIFIYPKYFHENTMLWEDFRSCWQVNSYEEMEDALRRISEQPGFRPYSDDHVREFITAIVYGGVENRDVLGGYEDCLLSLAQRERSLS